MIYTVLAVGSIAKKDHLNKHIPLFLTINRGGHQMRTFFSRKPLTFLLIGLILIGAILACNLPTFSQKDEGLSQEEALQLVLDEVVKPDHCRKAQT